MRGLAKYGIIAAFIPIVAHGADAPIPHHAAKYCVHEGKKCRVGDICHSHGEQVRLQNGILDKTDP
jgi:hypothetical protein